MITADGNDKIHCNCPYCGESLLVNLPTLASPVTPSVQQPIMGQGEQKGSGSTLKVLLTILIVLILGGLAVFGYIYWNNQKEAAQQELQAQRKAQADSMMQVRAQIEAQEAEAQRQDEKRKSICRFLESFYKKAVLTDDADADFYSRYLTDYCHRMVFGTEGSYDYDVDAATVWWGAFGKLRLQEPDFNPTSTQPKGLMLFDDNWYKVRLSQDGETEYRQVKVLSQDGHILIET